jgi:hypothetical protein
MVCQPERVGGHLGGAKAFTTAYAGAGLGLGDHAA